jgi:hypothetical protein
MPSRTLPLIALAFAAALPFASAAQSPDSRLLGRYEVVGSNTCLTSPAGFNANNQPIDAAAAFFSGASVSGIVTFHGNGTASFQQTSVTITNTPPSQSFPPSGSSSTLTGNESYLVGPNNQVKTRAANVAGTVLTGPRTGQTFTIDLVRLAGTLSADNRTLVLATTEPDVETVTFSDGTVNPRICENSRVLVRIAP